MKILLINPPIEDFYFTPQRAYPLGILYLATVLDKAGFAVKIVNCLQEYIKQTLGIPSDFSYLKKYYPPNKSPFRLFSQYHRFGLTDPCIKEEVAQFRPDVVGISANFSAYLDSSFTVARLVKQADSRITVVLGGRASTVQPVWVLSNKYVDFVLRGEAEFSFLELCQAIKIGNIPKIHGLCYKKSDGRMRISKSISFIKDLNALPIINRKLINYKKYRFQKLISTSLLASRGCGMRCGFCAIQEPFRYRRAENVLKEMEDCFVLGIRHFNFEDDNINLNPEFERMLDMAIDRFKGEIKMSFMNGLLSTGIHHCLKKKLVKAGLTHLDLSMASSSRRLRQRMHRRENLRNIFSIANFMAKQKVPTTVHFIIGFPQQKFKDAVRDIKVLATQRVMLGPSIFYPVIGSKMFNEIENKSGFSKSNYRFFRSSTACFDKFITQERIFLIFYVSRIINFIKELVDNFEIGEVSLIKFLRKKVSEFTEKENILCSEAKLDRFTLGMVLLKKLMEESRIYRVKETRVGNVFHYHFIEEEFVSPEDIKDTLAGLAIKGITGRMVYL